MKKLLSLFILAVSLIFASQAIAASYGPDFAKFTIKPLPGWTATEISQGVQVTNGKSALAIVVVKDPGMSLEDFAKAVVQQAGVTDAEYDTSDKDLVTVKGKKDNTKLAFVLTKADGNIVNCTLAGPDTDDMMKIIDSLEDAK